MSLGIILQNIIRIIRIVWPGAYRKQNNVNKILFLLGVIGIVDLSMFGERFCNSSKLDL